jgi:hypothetical protein
MMRRLHRALVFSVCVIACAAVAATCLPIPATYVHSADQNGDGRPDIWRTYNRHGQLAQVAVDTNFDGRADVREFYEGDALVRRESDRDFNDRVDLTQDFDPTTRQLVRSVADVDFDGIADLLVLFRDGQPVYSKWVTPAAPVVVVAGTVRRAAAAYRASNDQLAPLVDPFRTDRSVRAVHILEGAGDYVGLSTSGGLPASCCDVAGAFPASSAIPGSEVFRPASTAIVPSPPRGPPASSSLA